jgi:hypothetical protein
VEVAGSGVCYGKTRLVHLLKNEREPITIEAPPNYCGGEAVLVVIQMRLKLKIYFGRSEPYRSGDLPL